MFNPCKLSYTEFIGHDAVLLWKIAFFETNFMMGCAFIMGYKQPNRFLLNKKYCVYLKIM